MNTTLFKLLDKIEDKKELKKFLEISFTEKEINTIEERWRIFQSLAEGKTQRTAAQENQCSVVTVTRGAKTFRNNKSAITKHLKRLSNG